MRLLLLLCSAVLAALPASTSAAQVTARYAPLDQIVSELQLADPVSRIAFVEAAVAALSARYRVAARAGGDDPSWVRGTRGFIVQLEQALETARQGAPIQIIRQPDEGWRVVVGARPARQFVLVPPRPQERAALEREVVDTLCARIRCEIFTADDGTPSYALASNPATPAPGSEVRRMQKIVSRADGLVPRLASGPDGLKCDRGDGRHARLFDLACERVVEELRSMARALHAVALAGSELDWAVVSARRWKEPGQRLLINPAGDSVIVTTPLLARFPDVYAAALPWLRALLTGKMEVVTLRLPPALVYASGLHGAAG